MGAASRMASVSCDSSWHTDAPTRHTATVSSTSRSASTASSTRVRLLFARCSHGEAAGLASAATARACKPAMLALVSGEARHACRQGSVQAHAEASTAGVCPLLLACEQAVSRPSHTATRARGGQEAELATAGWARAGAHPSGWALAAVVDELLLQGSHNNPPVAAGVGHAVALDHAPSHHILQKIDLRGGGGGGAAGSVRSQLLLTMAAAARAWALAAASPRRAVAAACRAGG